MKFYLKTFSCCLVIATALPLCAQTKQPNSPRTELSQSVERAVVTAQQPTGCTCQGPLDTREIIEAEEELQHIRDTQDSNASFAQYPYLLDPNYRRKGCACAKGKQFATPKTEPVEPLDTRELIEAEEELALIRSTLDMNATFDKYPYLLNPDYRRADENGKSIIRRPFFQPTWAKKVGI